MSAFDTHQLGELDLLMRRYNDVQTQQIRTLQSASPRVTALPTSPYDGMEVVYLADATNGIAWNLKYRAASASAYKWEFIGGMPLEALIEAAGTRTVANAFGDLGSGAGPTITVPLGGDYVVDVHAVANAIGAAAGNLYAVGPSKNGAAPAAPNGWAQWITPGANYIMSMVDIAEQFLAMTAGDTLRPMYYAQASTTSQFQNRRITAVPRRVG